MGLSCLEWCDYKTVAETKSSGQSNYYILILGIFSYYSSSSEEHGSCTSKQGKPLALFVVRCITTEFRFNVSSAPMICIIIVMIIRDDIILQNSYSSNLSEN